VTGATVSDTARRRLTALARAEFEALGLNKADAATEAESFMYSAAEVLGNRLVEAQVQYDVEYPHVD
jgi:hypothetical protein